MTTKDEVLKLALRSLRELVPDDSDYAPALQGQRMRQEKAIKATREALNAPLAEQPAQQEAQIVRWNCPCGNKYTFHGFTEAPAQRKPLTKTKVGNYLRRHAHGEVGMYRNGFKDGVRYAEAAHDIKE